MKIIKVGFIGGCINKQKGIGKSESYYSVLSGLLTNDRIKHQISLGTYHDYNKLDSQVKKFIEIKHLDVVYLFIRPFPLLVLNKVAIKYNKTNNKKTYMLHPQFFSRRMKWDDKLNTNQSLNNPQTSRSKLFKLQDINIITGILCGLHKWSLKYLLNLINILKQWCDKNNVKLIIITPPQYRKSLLSFYICKSTNSYLNKYCSLPIVNVFEIEDFESDKIHLNKDGHQKLANLIYSNIKQII